MNINNLTNTLQLISKVVVNPDAPDMGELLKQIRRNGIFGLGSNTLPSEAQMVRHHHGDSLSLPVRHLFDRRCDAGSG